MKEKGTIDYFFFGNPIRSETFELQYKKITRKVHYFRAGDIFAIDLWDRNEYGTTKWSVYVIQALYLGDAVGSKMDQKLVITSDKKMLISFDVVILLIVTKLNCETRTKRLVATLSS